MVDVDELRRAKHGPPAVDQLLEIIDALQVQLGAAHQQLNTTQLQLDTTQQQLQSALVRIAALEKQSPPPAPKLNYSLDGEAKRQNKRGQGQAQKRIVGRRGRLKTKDKIALAARTETIYPDGVPPEQCRLSHTRVLWRLENGQAILVAYEIYRGSNKQYGQVPGTLGRCEFGLEIVTQIAFLVYTVGLSFDKVVLLLKFFQNLNLTKTQADRLMNRLAKQWEHEFETLCSLLSHSLIVHADETSWSLNSVWAMLSEKARILLFGVHKDAKTLEKLLDPATFAGLVISDHAAVYNQFDQMQKCWAHLIRKAIKLSLQAPNNAAYQQFLDGLLAIDQEARRVQRDEQYSVVDRAADVTRLKDRLWDLCPASELGDEAAAIERSGFAHAYYLLVREVFELSEQLFAFVTAPVATQPNGETKPVDGTNNEAERTLRGPALVRKTGRTNKSMTGAWRQTILTRVLESLRLYLPKFTFRDVVDEINRWPQEGCSCFSKLLKTLNLQPMDKILDRLFPSPAPTG